MDGRGEGSVSYEVFTEELDRDEEVCRCITKGILNSNGVDYLDEKKKVVVWQELEHGESDRITLEEMMQAAINGYRFTGTPLVKSRRNSLASVTSLVSQEDERKEADSTQRIIEEKEKRKSQEARREKEKAQELQREAELVKKEKEQEMRKERDRKKREREKKLREAEAAEDRERERKKQERIREKMSRRSSLASVTSLTSQFEMPTRERDTESKVLEEKTISDLTVAETSMEKKDTKSALQLTNDVAIFTINHLDDANIQQKQEEGIYGNSNKEGEEEEEEEQKEETKEGKGLVEEKEETKVIAAAETVPSPGPSTTQLTMNHLQQNASERGKGSPLSHYESITINSYDKHADMEDITLATTERMRARARLEQHTAAATRSKGEHMMIAKSLEVLEDAAMNYAKLQSPNATVMDVFAQLAGDGSPFKSPDAQASFGLLQIGEVSYKDCQVCGEPGTRKCPSCRDATYCSRSCQLKHWKGGHKVICEEASKRLENESREKRLSALVASSIEGSNSASDFPSPVTHNYITTSPVEVPKGDNYAIKNSIVQEKVELRRRMKNIEKNIEILAVRGTSPPPSSPPPAVLMAVVASNLTFLDQLQKLGTGGRLLVLYGLGLGLSLLMCCISDLMLGTSLVWDRV